MNQCLWKYPNLFQKDLNCALISPSRSSATTQVMWDCPDFPCVLSDPESTLFNFHRDILRSVTDIPQRCFFRYLPLYCKMEHTNGLTVYVSTRGIVGLEAHFTRSSRMSGSRHGCALYFPLCTQERIVYTWLRIVNSPSPVFIAPMLTVRFSQLLSGYYWYNLLDPNIIWKDLYIWTVYSTVPGGGLPL
jgi:hypothetical protein